jgi:predicted permease
MNMPLWAMLIAVTVALFPQLQHFLFFEKNGFIRGSVIFAIQTCGDVSIPLILVILGANLANEEPPSEEEIGTEGEFVAERKWSLTQRQRGIILGVGTRMVIVPVPTYPCSLVVGCVNVV